MRALPAALALAAFVSSGCLSATWRRDVRYGPPPPGALESLRPGESELDPCLALLGAPLDVWESAQGGIALAYGWERERNLGFTFSIPLDRGASASLNVVDERAKLRGVVLFFDERGKLVLLRTGLLGELREETRRPASADAEE